MYLTGDDARLIATLFPLLLINAGLLATAGSPFISLLGEHLSTARKKSFYDKYARQMTLMGVILGITSLLLSTGAGVLVYMLPGIFPWARFPQMLPQNLLILATVWAGLLLLGLALMAVYLGTWKRLRGSKGVHKALGALAMLLSLDCMVGILGLKRFAIIHMENLPDYMTLDELLRAIYLAPAASSFWPAILQTLAVSVEIGAGFGLVFLLMRRTRDDFGRDYYNFVLRFGAGLAAVACIAQMAVQGWEAYALRTVLFPPVPGTLAQTGLILWGGGLAASLLAAACWMVVSRSAMPLRQKPLMVVAALLAVAGLTGQAAALVRLFI